VKKLLLNTVMLAALASSTLVANAEGLTKRESFFAYVGVTQYAAEKCGFAVKTSALVGLAAVSGISPGEITSVSAEDEHMVEVGKLAARMKVVREGENTWCAKARVSMAE
jgi:hypothetical protein